LVFVNKNKDMLFLSVLLVFSFLIYICWVVIIPFNHAPDEFLRVDVVNFIYKYRTLPILGDNRLVYDVHGISYVGTPYLPYIMGALLGILVKDVMNINVELLTVARMISVLSGVGTIYFSWKISKKIFGNSPAKYFLPVFLAFIPQFAFVCSYINQDSFTVFLSAAMIYLWIRGIETNWDVKSIVKISILSGIILLSYLNGYAILVATLFIVLVTYKGKLSRGFLNKILIAIAIMALISGWFFIRNAYYYHGDFIGRKTINIVSEQRGLANFKPSTMKTLHRQGQGFTNLIFDTSWVSMTFKSFWAYFDYMSIQVNYKYYFLILILNVVAFMGISYKTIYIWKQGIKKLLNKKFYIALVVLSVISFLLHCYYSIYVDFEPQGRYMFPGLIAIIILMCKGIDEIIDNKKYKSIIYTFMGIISVLFNIYVLFGVLFIQYHGFK
jgi:hypothetical protein